MIVAATGHRPNKLGGYAHWDAERAIDLAMRYLTLLKPSRVISGMAQGWDQARCDRCGPSRHTVRCLYSWAMAGGRVATRNAPAI